MLIQKIRNYLILKFVLILFHLFCTGHLKDAIQTCCEKCSDKQKEGVKKVFKHLEEKKPDVLKQLKAEHDPKGEHEKECRDKIKA